jgi:hypothetical protein
MAYDEGLAERVRVLLANRPDYSEKKMFGGIAFMLGGHMACGISGDGLMLRVGKEAYAAALAEPHVGEFGPAGRPMTGWVLVDAVGLTEDGDLAAWVARGAAIAAALPPKE